MLPPMMPVLHDAFWFGLFAGLALFAWRAAARYDVRLSGLDLLRRPFGAGDHASAPSAWFTTKTRTSSTRPAPRSSGNTAFDDWRDGEIARIEAQRTALEVRLAAFEAFVDKLKRAKDRVTFDRFMAEHHDGVEGAIDVTEAVDHQDHRPA